MKALYSIRTLASPTDERVRICQRVNNLLAIGAHRMLLEDNDIQKTLEK